MITHVNTWQHRPAALHRRSSPAAIYQCAIWSSTARNQFDAFRKHDNEDLKLAALKLITETRTGTTWLFFLSNKRLTDNQLVVRVFSDELPTSLNG